jgi:hypothetical protein
MILNIWLEDFTWLPIDLRWFIINGRNRLFQLRRHANVSMIKWIIFMICYSSWHIVQLYLHLVLNLRLVMGLDHRSVLMMLLFLFLYLVIIVIILYHYYFLIVWFNWWGNSFWIHEQYLIFRNLNKLVMRSFVEACFLKINGFLLRISLFLFLYQILCNLLSLMMMMVGSFL